MPAAPGSWWQMRPATALDDQVRDVISIWAGFGTEDRLPRLVAKFQPGALRDSSELSRSGLFCAEMCSGAK